MPKRWGENNVEVVDGPDEEEGDGKDNENDGEDVGEERDENIQSWEAGRKAQRFYERNSYGDIVL